MASAVTYTRAGDVVTLTIDDGRVNSFGFDLIRELNEAMDRVSAPAAFVISTAV